MNAKRTLDPAKSSRLTRAIIRRTRGQAHGPLTRLMRTSQEYLRLLPDHGQLSPCSRGTTLTRPGCDQVLRDETVHGDTNRAWSEIHDRAYRIDGQSPLCSRTDRQPQYKRKPGHCANTPPFQASRWPATSS